MGLRVHPTFASAMHSLMRLRAALGLCTIVVAGLAMVVLPAPAGADDGEHESTTTTASDPGAVGIGDGLAFTGAVVTPLAGGESRTLDGYQAAVFVQSWLATGVYGNKSDIQKDPPAEAPVYRVDVTGNWGGPTGTLTVYFAIDGKTAYVSWPENQEPSTVPTTPPPPSNWFSPPDRAVDAFNGTAKLVKTAGTVAAGSTPDASLTEGLAAADPKRDSTTSPLVWVAVAAGFVLVAVGLWRWRRQSP